MMLLEHIGKAELAARGVPLPRGFLAETPDAAAEAATLLGGPVVVKAQVPAGGRGKQGGILIVQGPQAAAAATRSLLGRPMIGHVVQSVLVEEQLPIARELFLGLAVDPATAGYLALFSNQGGVDIEEVAVQSPERVRRLWIDPLAGLAETDTLTLFAGIADPPADLQHLGQVLKGLYDALVGCDALLAEINPLALLTDGRLVAADCRMEIDDDALFRQPKYKAYYELQMDEREREAAAIGVSYVGLDGDVGLIASGAGLGIASLDMLKLGGLSPANFLDTGGGITRELMHRAVQLTLHPKGVRGQLINLYGGINPMIEAALGIVDAVGEMPARKPLVVKMLGNRQEEAWAILRGEGIPVVSSVRTEDAVKQLAMLLAVAEEGGGCDSARS